MLKALRHPTTGVIIVAKLPNAPWGNMELPHVFDLDDAQLEVRLKDSGGRAIFYPYGKTATSKPKPSLSKRFLGLFKRSV